MTHKNFQHYRPKNRLGPELRATTLNFYIVIKMGKSAKNEIWLQLLTGGSYWPKTNASELHFARSFQGHPTWPYLERSKMHIWPILFWFSLMIMDMRTWLNCPSLWYWQLPDGRINATFDSSWCCCRTWSCVISGVVAVQSKQWCWKETDFPALFSHIWCLLWNTDKSKSQEIVE